MFNNILNIIKGGGKKYKDMDLEEIYSEYYSDCDDPDNFSEHDKFPEPQIDDNYVYTNNHGKSLDEPTATFGEPTATFGEPTATFGEPNFLNFILFGLILFLMYNILKSYVNNIIQPIRGNKKNKTK